MRSSELREKPRLFRHETGDDESDRPKRKAQPKHPDFPKTQVGKLWDELGHPDEPANIMPGGTYNSAGGKPPNVTVWGTIASIPQDISNVRFEELRNVHRIPCAREGLLYGIGAGFGVGGMRAILGGTVWNSCNFAVGAFTVIAGGSFAWCQRGLAREKQEMRKVVELMKARQFEQARKEKEEEAAKAREMQKAAEEERLRRSWTRWDNYRFWAK